MEFLKNISNVKVLVVGDVMLDRYWWGNVNRISPEAPVPIVNLESVSQTVGGAANVAANIAGLGAEPLLVGVVGADAEADSILDVLDEKKISKRFLLKSKERRTTVKTRIIAHNQQIVRIDQETKRDLNETEEEEIWKKSIELLDAVDLVILSDYAKGTLTDNLLMRLITVATSQGKFILVDPKGKNYSKYRGAALLTPNRFELAEACSLHTDSQAAIEKAGSKLLSELSLKYLLVTRGEDGMTLFERNKPTTHLTVEMRNVYDVTGAGDTVIACLAVSIGGGSDFTDAAKFANRAAGLVVEQVGTTAISIEMLNREQPNR
jgi:D-beta-D-heptose 7-phosphate kinase/D-beta-D-heptose 1-phosphate adenosyltransferase